MPGDHKKWGDFEKGMSELTNVLGIAGVQEEIPIDDAKALPDPEDYASHPTKEEIPIDIAKVLPDPDKMRTHPEDATTTHTKESHNPLDIPFGYEVSEINKGVKDVGGPDEVDEGGLGSGRNPEGGDSGGGGQPGPLISFGETILKEFVDAKISCPCNKN